MAKRSRKQRKQVKPGDWAELADLLPKTDFDADCLVWYEDFRRGIIHSQLPKLAELFDRRRIAPLDWTPFDAVFGQLNPLHSFAAPRLDWGFQLTEPQATKTLAHFLNSGPAAMRGKRIQAFLKALKVPNAPNCAKTLGAARVMAEVDRIDLEIHLPLAEPQRFRPILIEAKFDHKLTRGQLSRYNRTRKRDKTLDMAAAHRVLLGLTEDARKGLKGRQASQWNFVSWAELWLRFEKLRPRENNSNLTIFLHTLWHRIGGLAPGQK